MPLFLVERNLAQKLKMSSEEIHQINQITNEIGAHWLSSFLSADGKKTYCLYEAKDTQQLVEHAQVAGLPADGCLNIFNADVDAQPVDRILLLKRKE